MSHTPATRIIKFTPKEDAIVLQAVQNPRYRHEEKDFIKWKKLTEELLPPGFDCRNVRQRYYRNLNPIILKTRFTDEEDELLMKAAKECKISWIQISEMYFKGTRTDTQLRARYLKLKNEKRARSAKKSASPWSSATKENENIPTAKRQKSISPQTPQSLRDYDQTPNSPSSASQQLFRYMPVSCAQQYEQYSPNHQYYNGQQQSYQYYPQQQQNWSPFSNSCNYSEVYASSPSAFVAEW